MTGLVPTTQQIENLRVQTRAIIVLAGQDPRWNNVNHNAQLTLGELSKKLSIRTGWCIYTLLDVIEEVGVLIPWLDE